MSFGFSVGDLIGAANLTYRLIKALQGSHDAGEDYRAAIHGLGCMQQAFIRVSCLGANENVSQATFTSASFIVMGSMDIIESFLAKTKKYDRRLGGLGTSGMAQNLRKVGWTLYKAEDMKKLRETLHARLTSVNVLLVAANLEPNGAGNVTKYLESDELSISDRRSTPTTPDDSLQPGSAHIRATSSIIKPVSVRTPQPVAPGTKQDEEISNAEAQKPTAPTEAPMEPSTTGLPSAIFSLSTFSHMELMLLITDASHRSIRINEIAGLLRTLISMGEFQLHPDDCEKLTSLLDKICGKEIPLYSHVKAPIKFKDAIGRKFSFPWELAREWKVMEDLIKQAFCDVDVVGPHVQEGHYDLVGPDGEIILPQVWEDMIKPGWAVTMHMWPMPEPPPQPLSPTSLPIRQPSVDADTDHQLPLEDLQTPLSPSLGATPAMNTELPLSSESDQSTQVESLTSRTSTSEQDVTQKESQPL